MSDTFLLTRLRTSFSDRWFVAMFSVLAILVGLVAMHVLTGGMNEATAVSLPTASAIHHAHEVPAPADMPMTPSHGAPAGDCGGGPCMPGHDMLNMLCVLALLVTVILFALQLLLSGWPALTRVVSTLQRNAVALAPPAPPSLHVLSISRT